MDGLAITGYKYSLSVSTNNGSTYGSYGADVLSSWTSGTSFVITGLTNGYYYKIKIRAVNSLGDGAQAAEIGPYVPNTVPAAPTTVVGSSYSSGQSTATWVAPANTGGSNITNYVIQYSTTSDFSSAVTTWSHAASAAVTATVTGLSNGTDYYFRVAAVNNGTNGGQGSYSTISGAARPATTPGLPVFSSASSGNGTYTINWTAPVDDGGTPVTSYTVQLTDANQTVWDTGNVSTGITTGTKQFTGLSNGYSYRARVLAVNAAGSGSYMDPHPSGQSIPSRIPDNVGTPSSSAGDRSFTIDWTAPGNGGTAITTYWVQYSTDNVNWSTVVDVGDVLTKTWTGDGTNFRNNGTTYYGRVIAFNSRGNSVAWSAGSTGRVPAFTSAGTISVVTEPTSAPTYDENNNLIVAGVGHQNSRVMNVSFDPPNLNAFSYSFLQAHNDAGTFGDCTDLEYTALVFGSEGQIQGIATYRDNSYYGIIQQFNPGYNYTFRLVSVNTDGDFTISGEVSTVATSTIGYYTYDSSNQSISTTNGSTGFVIDNNSYSNELGSIARSTDTRTYSVTCFARCTSGTATICTSSRYFVSQWVAGTSYSGLTSYTGLQSPWSNNSGTTYRSASIGATSPYGSGLRVKVIGNGSIGSGWSPSITLYYTVAYRNRYYNYW